MLRAALACTKRSPSGRHETRMIQVRGREMLWELTCKSIVRSRMSLLSREAIQTLPSPSYSLVMKVISLLIAIGMSFSCGALSGT